jgi:hypothetical protein
VNQTNFTRNYGNQGGVVFVDSGSKVSMTQSTFRANFAVFGGVVYQQSEGIIVLSNCTFVNNIALKASLFYLYNSQNALDLSGGFIT